MIKFEQIKNINFNDFKSLFDLTEKSSVYVIKNDKLILGYGIIDISVDNSKYNYFNLYIKKEYRGNGYGNTLLSYLLEELKKIGVKSMYCYVNSKDLVIKRMLSKKFLKISQDDDIVTYVTVLNDK